MKPDALRLSRRHRAWLYGSLVVLFLTGAGWLIFHHYWRASGEFGPAPHPLEPWSLKVHGAAAMVFLVVFGTLLPGHVRRSWHRRLNRPSGALFLALNGLLILSGYALYYFGGERSRAAISLAHWLAGLGYPLFLVAHIWLGRRARQQQQLHPRTKAQPHPAN